MDLVRHTAPAEPVVTLDQAKAHLKVDFDEEDALIGALVDAATAMLDGHAGLLGRCLVSQAWTLRFDYAFPCWRIALPLATLISVDAIDYVDAEGVQRTLDPATYDVIDGPVGAVQPAYGLAWPATRSQVRAVSITFTAGYGADPAAVPRPLYAAILLLIGHLYAHREAVVGVEGRDSSTALPLGVDALIAPYRARAVA